MRLHVVQRTVLLSQFFPSVRPSVCVSVCLSARCVYCDKMKRLSVNISTPYEARISLAFPLQRGLLTIVPFHPKLSLKVTHPSEKRRLRQISAYNVWAVRDSEKVHSWRIESWPRALQRATDEVRMLPLSPLKGACSKTDFFLFLHKSRLQSNIVCYKVSAYENFQRQSCSTTIPLSKGL